MTDRSASALSPAGQAAPSSEEAGRRERRALAGRAGIVGAGTLVSRLLGLVRDQALAALFTRAQTDAFWVAFTIPNALRQLLGEGVTTSAVVPVLSEVRAQEGESAARRYLAAMRGVSLVSLVIATVLGILFARPLVELFAGGLHARGAGEFERAVELTRWLFPYIFFAGTAALGMAALNAYGRFAAAAFAPALLNVAFIACAFALPSWLESGARDGVLALAIGALLGGALQVIAQWPSLRRAGLIGWPRFTLSDMRVRQTLTRIAPMTFGIGVYYLDLILSRRFLSELPEGSQSYFSWAMRLCDFPQGIFVLALQAATLPSLSSLAARGHHDEVSKTYAYSMRLALFVAIPATALLVGLAHPLVVATFQRGAFDALSSAETARALMAQGLGIWTVAVVRQLLPVYYALGDTRTPVIVSAIDVLAFIGLALALRGPLGHVGVGLAVAASSSVQMLLLFVLLRRKLADLRIIEIGASVARTLGAAILAVLAGRAVAGLLDRGPDAAQWARLLPGIIGATVFGIVFLVCAFLLRSPELQVVVQGFRRRLTR